MKPLLERVPKYCWPQPGGACRILPSQLGKKIGELSSIAAALYAMYERGNWTLPWEQK